MTTSRQPEERRRDSRASLPAPRTAFQNFAVSETHVFSAKLTNELRVAYNRIALAFPNDPSNPVGLTLPSFDLGR
jgi:hypothetical protein